MGRLHATMLISVTIFAGTLSSEAQPKRDLTFEQRVDAQRAIERVYYGYQLSPRQPFEVAVPREALEKKVRTYLAQSVALAQVWNEAVTAEHLRAELARIARGTQFPDRLREVYHALGDDAFVIQECFVRPVLVSRLARNFFAFDETLQASARRQADEIFDRLATRRLDAGAEHPRRTVEELQGHPRTRAEVGRPDPVVEEREAFTVKVVLSANANVTRVATYSVPKRSWDDWWHEVAGTLAGQPVAPVALETLTVPVIALAAPSCVPDDTWSNGILDDVPDGRHGHSAVWTGSELLIWGGGQGDSNVYFDTGGRYDPLTDTWSQISRVNAPLSRTGHAAVWTGDRMVIWGGTYVSPNGVLLNTGGRYDPLTDTWTAMSTLNAPVSRQLFSAVWSGTHLIVWGGDAGAPGSNSVNTGGRYDPVLDVWTPTSTINAPSARSSHTAVWTGGVMLVWGGLDASSFTNSGGRYDPATDSWSSMTLNHAPSPRRDHTAIWTGSSMVVWGGVGFSSPYFNTGGRYDPTTNTWAPTSLVSAPVGRIGHKAVWAGGRMIVWGGGNGSVVLNDGKLYDPSADAWTPVSTVNAPAWRNQFTATAAGERMVLWGGFTNPPGAEEFRSGGRYDPATDTWTPTSTGSGPLPSAQHVAVWTGNEMIVWGGLNGYANTGGRYDPAIDAWTPTTTVGAPSPRAYAKGVWAGGRFVVWGGSEPNSFLKTGGRYDPLNDQWQPTSVAGAPLGRINHSAVSTGDRLIVWGGSSYYGGREATGGVYNVASDSWTPTAIAGAPSARGATSAVWARDRLIVWGGIDSSGHDLADGARYDPGTNLWSPVSPTGAPSARRAHGAVSTGSEMIVWGGIIGTSYHPVDGGRYDPATDTWAAVAADGAPEGRDSFAAVWTGSRMLVWGGSPGQGQFDTGARYDPATDTWTPTTRNGAPSPRSFHSAVWTGNSMLVWGGMTSNAYLASGGRYFVLDDQDGDCVARASDNCPAVSNPGQEDVDLDGAGDACDCAPTDPAAFAPPAEVAGVGWQPGWSLQWNSASLAAGAGTVYDVIRGTIGHWPVGSGSESYVATGVPSTNVTDATPPAAGAGFFYLVRGSNACGGGGFGLDSAGRERGIPAGP